MLAQKNYSTSILGGIVVQNTPDGRTDNLNSIRDRWTQGRWVAPLLALSICITPPHMHFLESPSLLETFDFLDERRFYYPPYPFPK